MSWDTLVLDLWHRKREDEDRIEELRKMTSTINTGSEFDYLLADFAAEEIVYLEDGVAVEIAKVGGGTVGHSYTGNWIYRVFDSAGRPMAEGTDLYTGSPATHTMAADAAYDFSAFGEE